MSWQEVFRSENEVLSRSVTADGWIYRYMMRQGDLHGGFTWTVSICFVPVPQTPPA